MEDFTGQTALISGATRGIGKAITGKLLQAGANVIGIYANDEVAASVLAEESKKYSAQLSLSRCDIADEEAVQALFTGISEKNQSLEILVNCAGIRQDAMLAMMHSEQWQRVIDVNLTGAYLMAKQAVLLMMTNKYGRIVNITSPVAHLGFAGQANYAASKAGQLAMTRSLAKEVARKKITVNCVSPGFISTDFIKDLGEEQLAAYRKMVPMRRFGTPEEVADAVLFLASRRAAYITGSELTISGGL